MRNTYATISIRTLQSNADGIKHACKPGVKVCAVVKADAYGHGMIQVAQALARHVDYFSVALVSEGCVLRANGIELPILVFAALDAQEIDSAITNNLTLTASSVDKLVLICNVGQKLGIVPKVHLKIDTGMGRIGVHWNRAEPFIQKAIELSDANMMYCEGMYSHFSDSLDADFTKVQAERFVQIVEYAKMQHLSPPLIHISSSRSIFLYPEYHFTMVRPGIALYGIEPDYDSVILPKSIHPVLELKTKVVYFKVREQGESIGYGRSYTVANTHERIVTIPIGYADGYPRRLSNNGKVLIHGKKYPVVGRICMDQTMVSLGNEGEAYLEDTVTLIGHEGSETIKVEDIARLVDTTPHEITTCISNRVPRIYS